MTPRIDGGVTLSRECMEREADILRARLFGFCFCEACEQTRRDLALLTARMKETTDAE